WAATPARMAPPTRPVVLRNVLRSLSMVSSLRRSCLDRTAFPPGTNCHSARGNVLPNVSLLLFGDDRQLRVEMGPPRAAHASQRCQSRGFYHSQRVCVLCSGTAPLMAERA